MKKIAIHNLEISEADWEDIRGLAEALIEENKFDRCPIKCVVNAFITWVMYTSPNENDVDTDLIH